MRDYNLARVAWVRVRNFFSRADVERVEQARTGPHGELYRPLVRSVGAGALERLGAVAEPRACTACNSPTTRDEKKAEATFSGASSDDAGTLTAEQGLA